jgi:peptide/nickel transport system permease protein
MTASAPTAAVVKRRRGWTPLVVAFAVLVVVVGFFAPLLANDVPLVARIGGHWSFPAADDWFGTPPPGPGDLSWKQWWSRLPAGGDDFAIMPPWPYGPGETNPQLFRAGPSIAHPFGNDDTGRDVLARLVHGASAAVRIGGASVAIGALLGVLLGALAGYRRGAADFVVMRLVEVFLCFPTLLFLLFATAFFGDSTLGMIVVMASLFWTSFARIVRGELLSLRERDFVLVARGLGVPGGRILFRHLLPQLWSPIGVTAAFCMATAVTAEATLSFFGLGPGQMLASWGTMLRQGSELAHLGAWHLWVFPAVAIIGVVVCCHLLADRLRRRAGV